MKIGVITSGGRVAQWHADALRTVAQGNEFFLYDCTNSNAPNRALKNAGYYALNLMSVRNERSRLVDLPQELKVTGRIKFAAEPDGAWERLPEAVLDRIAQDAPDVILKFGMGLLRVPPEEQLKAPILSYHHGDPRRFRGRPAGFYELLQDEPVVGQIVQTLSNRLDAGAVVAFAETKAHRHSWRQTLVEALKTSPLLLPLAIRNALSGVRLPVDGSGRNYRLPSNLTAAAFAARLTGAKARRLGYGALLEKRWHVATAPVGKTLADLQTLDESSTWSAIPIPAGCTFLADPFFDAAGGIVMEAMRRDGRGVITRFADDQGQRLAIDGGHVSYPCTVEFEGTSYVLPEMSDWSAPRLFALTADGLEPRDELDVPGRPALLDATLFEDDGRWFLFASRRDEGSGVLRLWSAASPFGRFAEHPASPLRISPLGARMGGRILRLDDGLYRPGQDFTRDYGDGIILFRINALSPTAYEEEFAAALRFRSRRGPHTLNIQNGRAAFDYYEDRFAPLAGWRRLKQSRG